MKHIIPDMEIIQSFREATTEKTKPVTRRNKPQQEQDRGPKKDREIKEQQQRMH